MLRAAWGSGASGEKTSCMLPGERCKLRGPSSCALLGEAAQVEGAVLHVAWRGGAGRETSCMLLGGAMQAEGVPSCMLLDGAVRMVGKCRECRRGVRAQHAPFHAAGTRPTRAASRREHAPLAIVRARRFPPQVHAECAPLPAAGARRVRAVTDWKQSRSAAIFVLHLFYALKCTFPSKHSNKLKKKCAVGENPSTPSCKSALWYCPHRAWSEQPCNHGDVNGARHVFAPPVALKGCVTGALLRASCIIRRMAWLTLSFPSP